MARRLKKKQLQYNTLTKQKRLLAQKSKKTARRFMYSGKGRINKNENTWEKDGSTGVQLWGDVHREKITKRMN